MGIPMLKIRRSRDRLICNMGIAILVRKHLCIETPPPPPPGHCFNAKTVLAYIGYSLYNGIIIWVRWIFTSKINKQCFFGESAIWPRQSLEEYLTIVSIERRSFHIYGFSFIMNNILERWHLYVKKNIFIADSQRYTRATVSIQYKDFVSKQRVHQ